MNTENMVDTEEPKTGDAPHIVECETDYIILRCSDAGVHIGRGVPGEPFTVLRDARRLFDWDSEAETLSDIALWGFTPAAKVRLAPALPFIAIRTADICEVLPLSALAKERIYAQPDWPRAR